VTNFVTPPLFKHIIIFSIKKRCHDQAIAALDPSLALIPGNSNKIDFPPKTFIGKIT
jgi:hypothetical protein